MDINIILGLAAIILPVLAYFAGVHRTEKRLSKDDQDLRIRQTNVDRDLRIQRVLDGYMDLRRGNHDSGLSALQRAGVSMLHNDGEIRELIDRIVARGERHPLSSKPVKLAVLERADLKIMFDYMTKNGLSFRNKNFLEAIEESGARERNN